MEFNPYFIHIRSSIISLIFDTFLLVTACDTTDSNNESEPEFTTDWLVDPEEILSSI